MDRSSPRRFLRSRETAHAADARIRPPISIADEDRRRARDETGPRTFVKTTQEHRPSMNRRRPLDYSPLRHRRLSSQVSPFGARRLKRQPAVLRERASARVRNGGGILRRRAAIPNSAYATELSLRSRVPRFARRETTLKRRALVEAHVLHQYQHPAVAPRIGGVRRFTERTEAPGSSRHVAVLLPIDAIVHMPS